jgi:predicted nucleic acid-binding protein
VTLYLDASILLPTLVVEPASAAVDAFLLACADDLIVSDFAAAEVASALSRLVRMGRLTAREAADRLANFDDWRAGATEFADMGCA